ncbi:MAG: transketolase [Flavobacteriales bacterium]
MEKNQEQLQKIANTIRGLSMDAVAAANSGHPGLPLGMADVAAVLWTKFLKFNPTDPTWQNRDRFVLSAGHGSMLIYSILHLFGYDLTIQDLKSFRQWKSKTPGHPENYETKGVETTTGPLGQGVANAVGMALAEKSLAARFNKKDVTFINHYTYVIAGDGCLQEGISHEAASFAGHNKLDKLILLYDSNQITIDGKTDLSYSEDAKKRFDSYNWHVQSIDGHDYAAIEEAIQNAKNNTTQPSIIICTTQIGFGSPNRAGTSKAHGEPFPEEEIMLTKKALNLPEDKKFYVSEEVASLKKEMQKEGKLLMKNWEETFLNFKKLYPIDSKNYDACINRTVSLEALNIPEFEAGTSMATRAASGKVLDYIAPLIPSLMGGSADLSPSNKTFAKGETAFSSENPLGRYIHYGVREHGMTAIMNGLSLHGGVLPYAGTFFVFVDYMRPAMRMAALMGIQSIYVLTHDSIGLGEDGPTHQPIEHLSSLRCMPNMSVIRPMCANETAEAWKIALKNTTKPTCLVLTRQNLPIYNRQQLGFAPASETKKGAYILTEDEDFNTIIIATGSEVEIAINAKKKLNQQGYKIRIVSMPSTDLFDQQEKSYQEAILPKNIKNKVAIEAAATLSWYKYVGLEGKIIGIDRFGASAPYKKLYEELGITEDALIKAVKGL